MIHSDLLGGAVPKIAHAVVGGLHAHGLLLNDFADLERQIVVLEGVAIGGDGGIFAALALGEDGVFIAAAQRGFDVDPAAMQRAGEAAGFLGLFAQTRDESLQVGREKSALRGEIGEERFEVGVFDGLGG